jgi:regulator of replication initiation timing
MVDIEELKRLAQHAEAEGVQRYCFDQTGCDVEDNEGPWVSYDDHLAALSAVTAERNAFREARNSLVEENTLLYEQIADLIAERDQSRAEAAQLKNTLLDVTTRHFASSWKRRTDDADLERYLSDGIAQLEADNDRLRLAAKYCEEIDAAPENQRETMLYDTITERNQLRVEVERLRMQLAACGVVAMSNTPESAAKARDMHPDYMSASCQDVMRVVDREMALRAEVDAMRKDAERYRWLRTYAYGHFHGEELEDLFSRNDSLVDEKVDEAIDAAMAAKDGQP